MSEVKHIDYIGFTFNGVHSSSLGIVRTSEGSRFNENLLPTIQDKTVQVPGGDGMYHFGGYYTQKQFNISYAFDALTEEQLAEIKRIFGDKKIHELIFDEAPYKKYYAKVTGSASIKHIPFAEGATNRVYKGEGSIQFTAYDPYGYSVKKYLKEYTRRRNIIPRTQIDLSSQKLPFRFNNIEPFNPELYQNYIPIYNDSENVEIKGMDGDEDYFYFILNNEAHFIISVDGKETYLIEYTGTETALTFQTDYEEEVPNLQEWKDAAGLLDTQEDYDKLNGNKIKLYNPGVKETDFILSLKFKNGLIPAGQVYISVDGATQGQMALKAITPQKEDDEIRINSKLNLIEGYKNGKKTGTVYNKFIAAGTFFKIPVSKNIKMTLPQSECFNFIDYDYIYF